MDIYLKPCPFCGSKDVSINCRGGRYGHFTFVECNFCGGKSGSTSVRECAPECPEHGFCESAEKSIFTTASHWNSRQEREVTK